MTCNKSRPPTTIYRPYIGAQYPHLLSKLHLSVCYALLDAEITTHENHLLRLPFSVHPQTGKICVPLDVACIDMFNPYDVPGEHNTSLVH